MLSIKSSFGIIFALLLSACQGGNPCQKNISQFDGADDMVDVDFEDEIETSNSFTGGAVHASEDGRVTIESGICPGGGTEPDFWAKWTIITDEGKSKVLKYDPTSYKRDVHSLKRSDESVYYLVKCVSKYSSVYGSDWLEAYKIVGDTVKQVNVIDGSETKDEHRFEVEYSIPDWSRIADAAGFDWMLDYDASTGNLYVPLEEDYSVLDRYDVWHFNGVRFEYLGQKPNKDLNEELCDYNRLIKCFTTKDYIIRVDSLDTGGLRYASWKKPKTMSDKPDAIITGGATVKHPVPSNELRPCDDYRFTKGKYEYIVNYCEPKWREDGWGEHHDYLLVKKEGKVILKQEELKP